MKTSTDDRTLPRALSAVGSLPAGSISLMAKPELATKFADRHSDRDRRRRRHSRYRSDFKVIVNHLAGDLFQKIEGRSKDMSEAGIGVLLAAELESFEFNKKVIDRCIENGVVVDWFLHCSNSMRIVPPLIITEEETRRACEVIIEALDHYANK